MKISRLLAATSAVFLTVAASTANAATIATNTILPSYTGELSAPTSSSANFRLNFVGSDFVAPAPNSRTPWENTAFANTGYYNSVEKNGFALYEFDTVQTSFSLMWGSPDDYNNLIFFNGDVSTFSMSGDDASITNTGGFQTGRGFVNVDITDILFTSVRFESTGADAFEFANVAPVPLPAAALLLLAAIGGLGAFKRRSQPTTA